MWAPSLLRWSSRKATSIPAIQVQNETMRFCQLANTCYLFLFRCCVAGYLQGKVNVGKVDGPGNRALGNRFGVKVGAERKNLMLSKMLVFIFAILVATAAAAAAAAAATAASARNEASSYTLWVYLWCRCC